MEAYDLAVIGAGPAGLAAAAAAYEAGVKKIILIERDREMGGILEQCIHTGFGMFYFREDLTGPEYAARFIQKVKAYGITFKLNTMVLQITQDKTLVAVNKEDGLLMIKAKAVVLAMGCRERTRGAILIPGTRPAGVITAGTAQRFVNMEGYMPGKEVVILGSGDIGLIMARRLTLEGAKVKMVLELLPYSSGLTRNIVQCLQDFEIPLLFNHTVVDIHGQDRITGVTIAEVDIETKKPKTGTERKVTCDTLLLSVGLIPENELSKQVGLALDPATNGPVVDEGMATSVEGIFAGGNVVHVHDLVDNVTRESEIAGRSAARYILEQKKAATLKLKTKAGQGVSYVVPQIIHAQQMADELALSFRVKEVYKDKRLEVSLATDTKTKVIRVRKRRILAPGEMQEIKVKKEELLAAIGTGESASGLVLTISVRKEDEDENE